MNMQQAEETTLREYSFLMYAHALKQVDKEFEINLLAWQVEQAGATKKVGKDIKPYYKTFKDFFDYEKRVKEVTGIQKEANAKQSKLNELILRANS